MRQHVVTETSSGGYALAQAVLRAWQRDGVIGIDHDTVQWVKERSDGKN